MNLFGEDPQMSDQMRRKLEEEASLKMIQEINDEQALADKQAVSQQQVPKRENNFLLEFSHSIDYLK